MIPRISPECDSNGFFARDSDGCFLRSGIAVSDGAGESRAIPDHMRRVGAGAASSEVANADLSLGPRTISSLWLVFSGAPGAQTAPPCQSLRG